MTDSTTYPASVHCSFHTDHGSISIAPWTGPEGGYALWHRGEVVWMSAACPAPRAWIIWCADGSGALAFTEDEADDLIAEFCPGGTKTPLFERLPAPPTTEPQE